MLSNLFNVFDFTFVLWLIVGAVSVLIAVGAQEWVKDLGFQMTWWKWTIVVIWYVALLLGLAAPFTFMGEGEVTAGLRMLGISAVIFVITGVAVWRILAIKGQSSETNKA